MKIAIEMTDAPDCTVDIHVEFKPRLTEDAKSPAVRLALWGIEQMRREAERSRNEG